MQEFSFDNYPYPHLLVSHFLHAYPAFSSYFLTFNPDITADVISFVNNPNCSCRSKVEKYAITNAALCIKTVRDFVSNNNIQFNIHEFTKAYFEKRKLSGKIVETTVENWPKLSEKIISEGLNFKGFSVVQGQNNNLTVYFL
jgi:hypothetical protein